jgi:hypothetical protein
MRRQAAHHRRISDIMASAKSTANPFAPSPDAVEAALLVEGPPTWMDRIADRFNPIFVKETRQALKSRQFIIAFLLLLAAGWLVSLFAVLGGGAGSLEYGDAGRGLFSAYFVVLAAAIVVVVPFGAFRSLLTEREEATFEPLIITALSPRQIVLGKLYSSLLQTFLFYSAIAPFMAFTALLQGFDIAFVSMVLALGLGISALACMATLAVSAMVKGRVWQTIVSLGVLSGLVWAFGLTCAMTFGSMLLDWDDPWFWWGLSCVVAAGFSYLVLLQQIAVANLTFHADNRSTGLRLICSAQFFLLWLVIGGSVAYTGWISGPSSARAEFAVVGATLSLLHWSMSGLFFVTEEDALSQRVIRRMPRSTVLRTLAAPFYPGGSRGLAFMLGHLAILWALALGLGIMDNTMSRGVGWAALGAGLYLVIYFNLGAMVARWAMGWSSTVQPIHARVITLLLIALINVLPMFTMIFEDYYGPQSYSLIFLPAAPMTLDHLSRAGHLRDVLLSLSIWAGAMTLINVPAMLRGIREVAAADPGPRETED